MELHKLLQKNRKKLVKEWVQAALSSHSSNPVRFARNVDQFANPVVYTMTEEFEKLFDELLRGLETGECHFDVTMTMRIRTVQDISPSSAASFPFELKRIIREELDGEIRRPELFDSLLKTDALLDQMGLLAFEGYMESREKIFNIKLSELKRSLLTGQPYGTVCPSATLDQSEKNNLIKINVSNRINQKQGKRL